MPVGSKKSSISSREAKEQLFADLSAARLTIGQATRRMRKIVGLTQSEYAEKVLKIYPRVLMEIEKDRGNPTLDTLEKIARPFGLKVGFVRERGLLSSSAELNQCNVVQ